MGSGLGRVAEAAALMDAARWAAARKDDGVKEVWVGRIGPWEQTGVGRV